jgi:hypothetical protein
MTPVEVREQRVEKNELRVRRLPDEEVRGPLLPRRPHEQVHVRDARLVQVAREHSLVDLVGSQPSRGHVRGDPSRSVGDLRPAAVVHAKLQGEHRVVCRHPLGVLEFGDHAAPEPRPAAGPADPDPHLVELIAPAADDIPVEAHEKPDFVRRAFPVLGGERVSRQVRDADLDRAHDHVEQRVLSGLVPLGARQPALLGPPAVAVHDEGHVPRDELGRDGGWSGTAAVRVRRPDPRAVPGHACSTCRSERIECSRCHCA